MDSLTESTDLLIRMHAEYNNSLFVRGDCNVQTAKALGALDARELYPDFKPVPFEDRIRAFYQSPLELYGSTSDFGK